MLSFALVSGYYDVMNLFYLEMNYNLSLAKDFEKDKKTYWLLVKTIATNPSGTYTSKIDKVEVILDNIVEVISISQKTFSVEENKKFILSLANAFVVDSGLSATYQLLSKLDTFTLNGDVLSFKTAQDYDNLANPQYQVKLKSTANSVSVISTLTINLTNTDDEPIRLSQTTLTVTEDTEIKTINIRALLSSDDGNNDVHPNSYSLELSSDFLDNRLFLSLNEFDYETQQNTYNLRLVIHRRRY